MIFVLWKCLQVEQQLVTMIMMAFKMYFSQWLLVKVYFIEIMNARNSSTLIQLQWEMLSYYVLLSTFSDGTFTDVTISSNVGPELYGNGASWADVDSDGDLDLFVTTMGDKRHYLYINQGGHFTEEALARGASLQFPSRRNIAGMTPTFGDFDLDGYVDIHVSEWIYHFYGKVSANRLLRNLGSKNPGYFEDVTESAGLNLDGYWDFLNRHFSGTFVFGSSFIDFNNDGWPELLISGDFHGSKLFWNNRNGTFTECTVDCGIDGAINAMGQTTGDINKDGFIDVMLTGVYFTQNACAYQNCKFGPSGNGLFQNNKNGSFSNIAKNVGVQNSFWAWGASFVDFDNDNNLDVVVTSGMDTFSTSMDDEYTKGKMLLYQKVGNQKLVNVALQEGMQFIGQGRGLLVFDFEEDGDEDILVVPNVGPVHFFRNDKGNSNFWIRVEAMHWCANNLKKLCSSYGARVYVTDKTGSVQSWSVGSKTNLLSQSEFTVHFGLGTLEASVIVRVFWPQTQQELIIVDVPVNTKIKAIKPESNRTIFWSSVEECPYMYVKDVSQPLQGKVAINEDMKSLNYDPSPLEMIDIGFQNFTYTIGVKPDHLDTQYTGIVELDIRAPIEFTNCKSKLPVDIGVSDSLRQFNGKLNNKNNADWGSVFQPLVQIVLQSYSDNISKPASACSADQKKDLKCLYPEELGGLGSNRPSPRYISNILMKQYQDQFSKRNLSDLIVHYGQFINHDTDHAVALPKFDLQSYDNQVWMPISIPKGDVHFDPYKTGQETMPFLRTQYDRCTGIYPGNKERKQLNNITAYIDGSLIYGSSSSRCASLREFKDGKMKLKNSFPPKNVDGLPNDNPTGRPFDQLYVTGDVRANVQPGLMALHTLFLREHNRLAQAFQYRNPMASDEEIFQYARRIVIAELQSVTYREYLPAILGNALPAYNGYNDTVNSGIFNEFATAAFRFGHSQVNSLIFRLKPNGTPINEGHAFLREMYFRPHRLEREGGIDPLLRGAVYFRAQEVDLLIVDEMRNKLFPSSAAATGTQTGFDLASINIQRGRDHGLADFNTVRKYLGLQAYKTFEEITSDRDVAEKLKSLYQSVDNIDLWVGGLAEDHVPRSELGETFLKIILEQFLRIRDGDRFWYERILTKEEINEVESRTLSQIIKLNTGYYDCPNNVFFSLQNCFGSKDYQCIPRNNGLDKNKDSNILDLIRKNQEQMKEITILTIVTSLFGVLLFFLVVLILYCAKIKKGKRIF
ncbi:uncharacterized protein LOC100209490 isoform X5 [Hydra vulgaris]|uniref:Uncharacterized protein LOC100209490 isoform X5 n=1 Tax=Hydra vulgaris TaxID=6087 RepID=A0ABM4C1T1_HYDVU